MKLKDLPKTRQLVDLLRDYYGLSEVQALTLVSDLNCENIEGYQTDRGFELTELFVKSSD